MLRNLLIGLLLIGHLAGRAQGTPLRPEDPLVQELLQRSRSTNSLKAEFTQEKHLKVLTAPILSSGIIRFEQPGKLRWQVDKPDPFVVAMDGKNVRVRENGVEREASATDKQVFMGINSLIGGILSGRMLDGQGMTTSFFKNTDGLRVEMIPTDPRMAKRMARVTLLFHTDERGLRELAMEQTNGDRTILRFQHAEFGVPHPSTTFTLP